VKKPGPQYVEALARTLEASVPDVLEHCYGQSVGALCPCGCGGELVLPVDLSSFSGLLPVRRLCGACGAPLGKDGLYRQGQEHFTRCRPCSLRGIRGFNTRPSAASHDHPFAAAFTAVLDRAGLNLRQACERAGLDPGEPNRWTRGARTPFRDTVERLANALDAPELLNRQLLAWRWRAYTMTCTGCQAVTEQQPGLFDGGQRRGFHQEAQIDLETGTGSWTCQRCKLREAGKNSPVGQSIATLRKREGRAGLRRRMQKVRAKRNPEQLVEVKGTAAWEKGQAALESKVWTDEERRRQRDGLISAGRRAYTTRKGRTVPPLLPGRRKGKFGLCRICRLITYSSDARRRVEVHELCRRTWERENGKTPRDYPPNPDGRQLSSEELAQTFEIAVRHLLRKEPIGDGRGNGLASEFALAKESVQKRVRTFIRRIPTDKRAGNRLGSWGAALREAAAAAGLRV
jgi:transcriptional regulator with XRE-family HTH domain